MKATQNTPCETTFDITGLTAGEFGLIVAALGSKSANYHLYDRLSDVAVKAGISYRSSDFGF